MGVAITLRPNKNSIQCDINSFILHALLLSTVPYRPVLLILAASNSQTHRRLQGLATVHNLRQQFNLGNARTSHSGEEGAVK